jgi:hypothetical protein
MSWQLRSPDGQTALNVQADDGDELAGALVLRNASYPVT